MKIRPFLIGALLLGAQCAWAVEDYREHELDFGEKQRASATCQYDSADNYHGSNGGLRGRLTGIVDLRLSVCTVTVFSTSAGAWYDLQYALPKNTRKVIVTAMDGSGTNYLRVGFTATTEGSAPTAGTEEAWWQNRKVMGNAALDGRWTTTFDPIQTRTYTGTGIMGTLHFGVPIPSAQGITQVRVESFGL